VPDERVGAALDRGLGSPTAPGETADKELDQVISRDRHERRVWTGSDGCALDTSRLRDYARGGGVGS
jgi:hypothetical protein